MTDFVKDQRVVGMNVPTEYRIEAGPYRGVGGPFYVLEAVTGHNAGIYVTLLESSIKVIPPKAGDIGRLNGYRWKWRLHHIDDVVATLQAVDGEGSWHAFDREHFDSIWRGVEQ